MERDFGIVLQEAAAKYARAKLTQENRVAINRYYAALDLENNNPPTELAGDILLWKKEAEFALAMYDIWYQEGIHAFTAKLC